jgi:hypothetical protein
MADNLSTTEVLTNPRGPATKKVRPSKISASIGPRKAIHPRSFWQKKVREFAESGLSKKSFCEQHSLKRTTFWNWHHKLTGNKNSLQNPPLKTPEKQKTQEFVSVLLGTSATEYSKSTIAQNYSGSPSFTLNFSKNLQLMIPKGFDGQSLRRLVQILSSQVQKV